MIYKFVDSACPLFLVSRHLSVRKMFACYIKITTCTFRNKPYENVQSSAYKQTPIFEKYLNNLVEKQMRCTINYFIHINLMRIIIVRTRFEVHHE